MEKTVRIYIKTNGDLDALQKAFSKVAKELKCSSVVIKVTEKFKK